MSDSVCMQSGDTVIFENKSNPHQIEIKFAFLKEGNTVKIAKGSVPHQALFGHAFGSKFEVGRGKNPLILVDDSLDMLQQFLGEEGDEGAEPENTGESRDNRQLLDKNALTKGKESSQKLGAEEIRDLKASGKDGKQVIQSLIDNSDTFKMKTEYSQAKWLKKKSAKHAPQFVTLKPSSLTLCRAYFHKEPMRICNLREDSLARLLTLSNVQAGSRVLAVDSMNGLMLGAVAERLGGLGKILHGYNGLQPSVDAVRWMNFDEAHVQTIINFPLAEISFLGQEIPPPPEPTKPDAEAMETDAAPVKGEEEGKKTAEDGVTTVEEGKEGENAEKKEWVPLSPIEARRRRVEGGHRASMSFRGEGSVRQPRPTVEEIQKELEEGFDSLVVAGSLDPTLLVPKLLPLLKPSSPLVVYSATPQPLMDLQQLLIQEETALEIHISETWMREYQVLPGRTHPMMNMSAASGFLLSGIRVNKKIDKPAPDLTTVAAPATKRRKTD